VRLESGAKSRPAFDVRATIAYIVSLLDTLPEDRRRSIPHVFAPSEDDK
jgi:hypothetical protein